MRVFVNFANMGRNVYLSSPYYHSPFLGVTIPDHWLLSAYLWTAFVSIPRAAKLWEYTVWKPIADSIPTWIYVLVQLSAYLGKEDSCLYSRGIANHQTTLKTTSVNNFWKEISQKLQWTSRCLKAYVSLSFFHNRTLWACSKPTAMSTFSH